MNIVMLNNLTDSEFLRHIHPATELEGMLVRRLECPDADPDELEEALSELRESESAREDAEYRLERKEEDYETLKDYAKSLHKALSDIQPDNELLDDKDSELLK